MLVCRFVASVLLLAAPPHHVANVVVCIAVVIQAYKGRSEHCLVDRVATHGPAARVGGPQRESRRELAAASSPAWDLAGPPASNHLHMSGTCRVVAYRVPQVHAFGLRAG